MARSSFKQEHDLEKRCAEAARIREKYPDRIPQGVAATFREDTITRFTVSSSPKRTTCVELEFYEGKATVKLACAKNPADQPIETHFLNTDSLSKRHHKFNMVIVEKAEKSDVPNIDKKKYLVPADLTVGQFVYVIRKRIKLSAEKAIFIFVDSVLPPTGAIMSTIYDEKKDEDGFLYVTYSGENTFGGHTAP